jgi:heptosyltransferase-1
MRILIVRLSALGDIATGLAPLAALRARFPSGTLGWLVEARFADLLRGHPHLDRLHVYERGRAGGFWRAVSAVRRMGYDAAVDLQGNLKSGLFIAGSGAGRRVGLGPPMSREGNGLFVRERFPPRAEHRVEAYLGLLDDAFGPGPRPPPLLPAVAAIEPAVVLHPGTSRFGAFKQWPLDRFAALGRRLAARFSLPVVVTAGPGERAQAEAVAQGIEGARVVEPRGLAALRDVLAGARLVVAGDTGPAHVAAALGVPTLTLFGPKDPRHAAPYGPRARHVVEGVRCSPCALRHCPDPVCMTRLGVEKVERAAIALLEEA